MPRSVTPTATARVAALLFFGWLAFFALINLLGVALAPASADRTWSLTRGDLLISGVWTALCFLVGGYHRWLRRRAPSLIALIAAHLPLLVAVAFIDAAGSWWASRLFTDHPIQISITALTTLYFDFDVVAYGTIVAVVEVLLVRRALLARQAQAERLERSLARARLDYLEAQLQPHFLFNSLGAVSELAYDAPATAHRVLAQLASIFRTALGRRTDEITLGDEIVGIEPYLDIQRIRFADWLTIDYRIDDDAVDCLVPRFVLQPLIENAIRHGLSGRSAAGTIEISAVVEGGALIIRVADNGVGLDAATTSSGRGIGLSNVRDRLRILYGDDESLALTNQVGGGTVSELRIPARRKDAAAPVVEAADRADAYIAESLRAVTMPRLLRNRTAAIVVTWLLCGLAWTQQSYLYLSLRGQLNGETWLSLSKSDMTSALVWMLLTPIVFLFARRLPLSRTTLASRGPVYLAFAIAIVLVHNALWQRVAMPNTSMFASLFLMSFVVGFFIVCVLVTLAHRGVLAEWLRERENDAELLRAELDEARERAGKLQGIPPILLGALDGIADTVRRDPALTERQLSRLADYLRVALECSDERGMTPDRERALAAAVAELRTTGAYPLTQSA